jgi:hypothetical protein
VDLELHLARLDHLFHPAHLFQTILFRNFVKILTDVMEF